MQALLYRSVRGGKSRSREYVTCRPSSGRAPLASALPFLALRQRRCTQKFHRAGESGSERIECMFFCINFCALLYLYFPILIKINAWTFLYFYFRILPNRRRSIQWWYSRDAWITGSTLNLHFLLILTLCMLICHSFYILESLDSLEGSHILLQSCPWAFIWDNNIQK